MAESEGSRPRMSNYDLESITKPQNEEDLYIYELRKRLKIGAQEYGDKSFHKPEADLLKEIQEEILDIAGWSYILWAKIERLKAKL